MSGEPTHSSLPQGAPTPQPASQLHPASVALPQPVPQPQPAPATPPHLASQPQPSMQPAPQPQPTPQPEPAPQQLESLSRARRIRRALPVVGIIVSLVLLSWPVVTDWIKAWQADNTISQMSAHIDNTNDPERLEYLQQARAYNERLVGVQEGVFPVEQEKLPASIWPYEEQLRYQGSIMMAWIEIPRIGIKVPIYHGTETDQLAAGVGHLEGTSLPVGGVPSNCVLSAHSGMSSQRMFDDIRFLEPGDVLVIWTLGEPYAYKVESSETVLPEAIEGLFIEQGKDQVTLVTCTPYGVNSHRLLVHAMRTEYVPEEMPSVLNGIYYNSRMRPLLIGIAIVLAAGVVLLIWRIRARRLSY